MNQKDRQGAMYVTSETTRKTPNRAGIAIYSPLVVVAYVAIVVLLSYRDNLALAAKVGGASLGITFMLVVIGGRRTIVWPTAYKIWGLWFCVALISCLFAEHTDLAISRAQTVAQVAAVGFAITNILIWHRSTNFYVTALIGSALLASLMVWTNPVPFTDLDGRVYGPLGNANTFGIVLSVALSCSLVHALSARRFALRAVFLVATILIFSMLLQTGSRKAMFGGVLIGGGLICLAYLYRSGVVSVRSRVLAVVVTATIVPVTLVHLLDSPFWFRAERALAMFDGTTTEADTSLIGRMWLARMAVEIAIANPLLGVGLDNFRMAAGAGLGKEIGTYSHSNYLEILVSTGIAGFAIYFCIYCLLARQLFRLRGHLKRKEYFGRYTMIMVVTITLMIMDIAMVSYYDKVFWLVFPWIVAEMFLLEQHHKNAPLKSQGSTVAR